MYLRIGPKTRTNRRFSKTRPDALTKAKKRTCPRKPGDEGRQGVGRLMSVDVVRQPHSSLMGADIANPMPTPRQPSMVDVVHPPSMGAGVVGPMPAHVAYPPSSQSSIGVDVASGIPRRTLADVSHQPPTWTGSKPAYMLVSMLRCVREYRCVRQLRLLRPSRCCCWVLVLRRLSRHPTLVCTSGCRHPGQPQPRVARLSQCRVVALSYSRYSPLVLMQRW